MWGTAKTQVKHGVSYAGSAVGPAHVLAAVSRHVGPVYGLTASRFGSRFPRTTFRILKKVAPRCSREAINSPTDLFDFTHEPLLQLALDKNPAFEHLIEAQRSMFQSVSSNFEMLPAANAYSDELGQFRYELSTGAAVVHMKTWSGPEVDWFVAAVAAFKSPIPGSSPFVVVTTMIYPNPKLLTPILSVELGGPMPGSNDVLMFTNFFPVLNPFTHMDYLDEYYVKPPADGFLSFQELEQQARRNKNYKYFSSGILYNRLSFGTAVSYTGPATETTLDSIGRDVNTAVGIWLEYLRQDSKRHRLPSTPEVEREKDAMIEATQLSHEREADAKRQSAIFSPDVMKQLNGIFSSNARLHPPRELPYL